MKRILALLLALLFEGKLIQMDTPRRIYDHPASRQAADYFGNCVYIPGRVEAGRFTACGIDCAADAADGEYDIMLRPDCLHTEKEGNYRLTVESVSFRGSDTLVCFRAEDGTCFVTASDAEVYVCDARGEVMTSLPIAGRTILSLTLRDRLLLMVCQEENDVVLVAYDAETSPTPFCVSVNRDTVQEAVSSVSFTTFPKDFPHSFWAT